MFSEKKRAKEKSTLFTKFSCFCEYHLLCLFRKITFIIFQVQSPFSLSVTLFFFFLSSERIQANFMVFFPSFPLYNSSFCPVESSTRMTDWSIDNLFSFARHISFLLLWFQRGFFGGLGGTGNLHLFTIRMALFG